jgi:predicted nucleotidyltransferase component of viral defense system
MIPAMNIVAWGRTVPWVEQRQVEQDLIISRALIELFADPFLKEQLRFRGGTALNKLHFPKPLRYSEDLDFTRTKAGGIGQVLDRTRQCLEPWMGKAQFVQSKVAPKLYFNTIAEDPASPPIRVKVEINTRERTVYDKPQSVSFAVSNPWFSGSADIATFTKEEMLATKLRALLQRNKGRDLIDLSHAVDVFGDHRLQDGADQSHAAPIVDNEVSRCEQDPCSIYGVPLFRNLIEHMPSVTAIRARRMQKDQLQSAHTNPPSHSGRRASSRRPCDHKESAVVSRLSNLAGRVSTGEHRRQPCVSETSL